MYVRLWYISPGAGRLSESLRGIDGSYCTRKCTHTRFQSVIHPAEHSISDFSTSTSMFFGLHSSFGLFSLGRGGFTFLVNFVHSQGSWPKLLKASTWCSFPSKQRKQGWWYSHCVLSVHCQHLNLDHRMRVIRPLLERCAKHKHKDERARDRQTETERDREIVKKVTYTQTEKQKQMRTRCFLPEVTWVLPLFVG